MLPASSSATAAEDRITWAQGKIPVRDDFKLILESIIIPSNASIVYRIVDTGVPQERSQPCLKAADHATRVTISWV
jgi:hypothetical protein